MAKSRNAGCAAYMSPERIEPSDPNRPDYDIRADIWSLGITLVSDDDVVREEHDKHARLDRTGNECVSIFQLSI